MSGLNILLVGNLNPELDNFLNGADAETGLIRQVQKARGSVEDMTEKIRLNGINTVVLNPLTNDPSQPVDKDAIDLISEVRRVLPRKVVFVLYTDRSKADSLLKQHGLEVSHFIGVDPTLEEDPEYYKYLRSALMKCKDYLYPRRNIPFALRVSLALLLIAVYLAAIYITRDLPWLQRHPNSLGLYLCASIITISVCLALLKREWRTSALTVGAFGALLVIAQIIGSGVDESANTAEPPRSTGRPTH